MPASSQHRSGGLSRERRASTTTSGGSLTASSACRSVSLGKHRTAASAKNKPASSVPPILRTSSPSSPPVKGILLVNSDHSPASDGGDGTDGSHEQQQSSSTSSNSPSSYLKPLLKFLPRHIDPSTIARLLKNVHPSAFGSYRTKEAWRREHPEVLNTAYHLNKQAEEEEAARANGLLDVESSHAVLRPSVSSDEVCLAHSPPSATFSSSEDDDFDEEVDYEEDENDDYLRREAKELEDYFNEEFDDDLGTSPESASSLRDLTQTETIDAIASPGKAFSARARASSQDSITTAKNDSASTYLDEPAATSSPRSPLAIYLSKPDEEQDSPLAGPSQRVIDLQNDSYSSSIFSTSSPDASNDSSITVTSPSLEMRRHSPIASTSAAILYPEYDRSTRPHTPPSPASSSLSPAASPSTTSHRRSSSSTRSPSTSSTQSRSHHYPTIPIPRIVKRQRSSSSLASSNCTCRSNASNVSNASISSRSSSVKFAPLPEEELKKARMESLSRNGGSASSTNDKSKIMGIKGRRNLLLGLKGDEDSGSPSSGGRDGTSRDVETEEEEARRASATRDASYRRPVLDDEDEEGSEDDSFSSPSSSSNGRYGNTNKDKDRFDVIAFFGEEDLLVPPSPSSSSLSRNSTIKSHAIKPLDDQGSKSRKGSDVTIRYGKNGELVERRPLGVTLEELTLPMKRVKETRGRSRQTNDLSASFGSTKIHSPPLFASPPISPPSSTQKVMSSLATSPPVSPSRSSGIRPAEKRDNTIGWVEMTSPESSSEKTPMPTPRLEKLDLFLTASNTAGKTSSSNSTTPHTFTNTQTHPLSPLDASSNSGTSPTGSTHSNGNLSSGGSNDITPMPTPRAGSPIAGLKMTSSIQAHSFTAHTSKTEPSFKLMDSASFTLRSPPSLPSVKSSSQDGTQGQELEEQAILHVSPMANLLALGPLLDDALSAGEAIIPSPSSSTNSIVPSLTASGSSLEPESGQSDGSESSTLVKPEGTGNPDQDHSSFTDEEDQNDLVIEDVSQDEDVEEGDESDYEKTPTRHASLDLPKLNDTTHALHARYRKKRTVGIPHLTARKRPISASKKSKK